MKYTQQEYLGLGRTLQLEISDNLLDNILQYTSIAVVCKDKKYCVLYDVTKCYNLNPFDTETVTHNTCCFEKYEEMSEYVKSLGFSIDELLPAKGQKITF